jgi:hypothetical protein
MTDIPSALSEYMEGLRGHDIARIGASFSDDVKFVTPVRSMGKAQTLGFLTALYSGFPDWHYDNDPPENLEPGSWRVKWRQGGRHTETLALPGFPEVPATGREVTIPEHYFYYRVADNGMLEIRPDPVPGGAPRGIFEQIGVALPPL